MNMIKVDEYDSSYSEVYRFWKPRIKARDVRETRFN